MIDKHMSLSNATSTTPPQSPTADEQATDAGDETTVLKASACHKTDLDLSPGLPSAAIDISATGSLTVSVEEGLAPSHATGSTFTAAAAPTSANHSLSPHTALDRHNTHLFTPPASPTAALKDDNIRPPRLKRDSSIDVYVEAFGVNRPPTPTTINTSAPATSMTAAASSSELAPAPLTTSPTASVTTDTARPPLIQTSVDHDSNTTTTTTDTDANNNGDTVSNEEEVDAPLTCQGNTLTSDLTQQSTLLTSRITKHAFEHDLILLKQEYSRMFIESEYIYCSPFTRALETAVVALEGHRALRSNGLILNR